MPPELELQTKVYAPDDMQLTRLSGINPVDVQKGSTITIIEIIRDEAEIAIRGPRETEDTDRGMVLLNQVENLPLERRIGAEGMSEERAKGLLGGAEMRKGDDEITRRAMQKAHERIA